MRTNLPQSMKMVTPKSAPTAGPRVYVRCPPCSLASELLPRAIGWLGAHRAPAVGVRLRTNLPQRIQNGHTQMRPCGRTAGNRMVRCPPRSRCRSPLADEPSRAHRNVHTQKRPHGRPAGLRSVPAAFARKRAPTAGNRMARCPPCSPCRSPLADEPSTTHPKSSHPKTPLRPDRRIAFGARRVRSQASSFYEGCFVNPLN